ncbi:MAG TPA: hypothetical protein P5087_00670 [Eubacteriales bacterium]|nr:hypothetical protein [Eubacteriales bacterium]
MKILYFSDCEKRAVETDSYDIACMNIGGLEKIPNPSVKKTIGTFIV